MQQTGKIEIMSNIYFIASNGFILECVDCEYEYDEFDELEEDAESPKKKKKKKKKKIQITGLRKLLAMEEIVCQKEQEYERVVKTKETFDEARIKKLLKSKTENIKCIMHESKKENFMTTFNEITNNSRMNKDKGRIIPEIFN